MHHVARRAEPPRVYTEAMRQDVLILTSAAIIAVGIGIFMFSSGRGDLSNTSLVTATVPFTEIAKGSQSAVETGELPHHLFESVR